MKILIAAIMAFSSISFANLDCTTPEGTAYVGEVSQVSETKSFYDCPQSLLLNQKFVANLSKAVQDEVSGETTCTYVRNTLALICKN